MRKTKIAVSFVVIAVAILFAGNEDLYAGAGVPNPWGIVSPAPRGTQWKGSLVITAQIVDVPGLPGGLPADAAPVAPETGYYGSNRKDRVFCTIGAQVNYQICDFFGSGDRQ